MAKRVAFVAFLVFAAGWLGAMHYGTSYWNFDPPDMLGFPPDYIWDTASVTTGQWGAGNYNSTDYSVRFQGRNGYIISRAFDFDTGDTADITGWILNGTNGTVRFDLAYSTSQAGPWTQFYSTGNINGQTPAAFYTAENFTPPAPGTYYFQFTIVDNGTKTLGYLDDISLTYNDGTLPVELSSFTAVLSAFNFVQLTWVSQSETNVSGYRIYRNTSHDLQGAVMLNTFVQATNTSQMQVYVFVDEEIFEPGTFYYWLESLDFDGSFEFFGPVSIFYYPGEMHIPTIPLVTELLPIYPNPFNPLAQIPCTLAESGEVSIEIYNSRGQLLRSLELGPKAPGRHETEWDGLDSFGQPCATGVYHFRMKVGTSSHYRKAVLLK